MVFILAGEKKGSKQRAKSLRINIYIILPFFEAAMPQTVNTGI